MWVVRIDKRVVNKFIQLWFNYLIPKAKIIIIKSGRNWRWSWWWWWWKDKFHLYQVFISLCPQPYFSSLIMLIICETLRYKISTASYLFWIFIYFFISIHTGDFIAMKKNYHAPCLPYFAIKKCPYK